MTPTFCPINFYLPSEGETQENLKCIPAHFAPRSPMAAPGPRLVRELARRLVDQKKMADGDVKTITLVAADGSERSYEVEAEMVLHVHAVCAAVER